MNVFEYIECINLLHKLIEQKSTGNTKALSQRLNLSVGRLNAIIDDLRSMGAPICYSRTLHSYYYAFAYEIDISISFGALKHYELKVIRGGQYLSGISYSGFLLG